MHEAGAITLKVRGSARVSRPMPRWGGTSMAGLGWRREEQSRARIAKIVVRRKERIETNRSFSTNQ
jgi:hypothetical protein